MENRTSYMFMNVLKYWKKDLKFLSLWFLMNLRIFNPNNLHSRLWQSLQNFQVPTWWASQCYQIRNLSLFEQQTLETKVRIPVSLEPSLLYIYITFLFYKIMSIIIISYMYRQTCSCKNSLARKKFEFEKHQNYLRIDLAQVEDLHHFLK